MGLRTESFDLPSSRLFSLCGMYGNTIYPHWVDKNDMKNVTKEGVKCTLDFSDLCWDIVNKHSLQPFKQ